MRLLLLKMISGFQTEYMRNITGLAVLLFICSTINGQIILHSESFETDGEGTRYTTNTFVDCPNADFFFRTNSNPVTPPACGQLFGTALTNLQGSFFWASEDIRTSSPTPGSRPPGSITTQGINVAGFSLLSVSLYVATSNNNGARWEAADSLNIQASFDGVNYSTVGRFMGKGTSIVGARLGIDGNLDGIYNGSDPVTDCDVANFTRYSFSIPGTGSSLRIRLDFDQVGGTEELAVDLIEVSGSSTVPVILHYFNGYRSGTANILNWKIDGVAEASHFILERSPDGINFMPIHTMQAGIQQVYDYTDHTAGAGIACYRLRMVDKQLRETLSPVVKISGNRLPYTIQVLYGLGQPAAIHIGTPADMAGQLCIYSMTGQPVIARPVYLENGNTVIAFPAKTLPGGVYIVQLRDQYGILMASTTFLR